MRFAAIAVGLALLWPMAAAAAKPSLAPAVAGSFAPHEHDFTVAFPGIVKTGFHMLLAGRERLYMDNEGDRLFMVTASSFLLGAHADEQAYDRRLKRFADNAGATLVSSQRLKWGDDVGCEGLFTTPQANLVLVRMVVHDKRLYQAVFWGKSGVGGADADEGRRFMDSFRLTDH